MRSKISLLPDALKRKNKLRNQIYMILTTVISIAIALSLAVSFVILYRLSLNSTLKSLNAEREMLQKEISTLKTYEEMDKKISSLEQVLAKTAAGAIDFQHLLLQMSHVIPGGVSITELSATPSKEGLQVKIKGIAIDNYRLALWVQSLRSLPELKNIQLSYAEKKKLGTGLSIDYEITAFVGSISPISKEAVK